MRRGGLYWLDGTEPQAPGAASGSEAWGSTAVVGRPMPRIDAYERVSGTAVYPSDLVLPDMLYGAILRCPHPHARVRSVDLTAAASMPGVCAAISGSSPEADLRWSYTRQVFTKLFDPTCRFEGEAVAAVAAQTPQQARDALRAIRVEYEVLPFVVDETRALAPDAPGIAESGNLVGEPEIYTRGDVAKGFAEADAVVERTYRTACELHVPMELHGCVARWDGPRLTIWESTQGVFPVQQRVAALLGLPLSRVRVIGHYMGGGFGSKLGADKYNLVAAVLARVTARPVKLFLTREETLRCVGNRPPTTMRMKGGVKKDGTLTALEMEAVGASGGYPAGGASLVDWVVRDLYRCPNVRCESKDVLTTTGPARPFRAPGHPQGAWALEQLLDELAHAIGMDPVALRLANVPEMSQGRGNRPYSSSGLRQCLEEGARAFGWAEARRRPRGKGPWQRGVGMAAGTWVAGGGGPPATVIVKLFADGSANLNMGASDIGTGTKTVMAMVVAEELGVPLERIQVEHADTGTTQFATASGGSKTVPTEAPATRAAALEVKRQVLELAAEELKVDKADLRLENGVVVHRTDPALRKPLAKLAGLRRQGVVVGVGTRAPNPEDVAICPFAAQFCEVEVNRRTGEVRVLRFLAAQDSGRVMNRLTFDSQVIGGITMGIGLGLTEQRVLDAGQTGRLVSGSLHDYKLPTMLDVPADIVSLPIEIPDTRANSTGAKGLGEPATIPTAAAVANAVFAATGVRVTDSPITPARLLPLLAAARKES
ncbi:MAG TPA: xanthine dehydrogenase family protein molybdopterin-binding subunit [Thermoanaerobaculaceae bacterium]|nr:xanthine dehydrogenase family protein molybdopterin-binding subunit [Thermoanaerobaculaceae bacterium]HRS16387.1 xanthine dehydrogenase family protein molybdopterin-binding subunit [Thermoanaerobaculaceae bacterium]